MSTSTWIILGVIVVVVLFAITVYNGLISMRQRTNQAFADIDVQLKQRHDLIPNLVETVKGYAAHEKDVLENVTRARAMLQQAGTPGQAAEANNMLTSTLRSLFAVAENYPDLKANQNFLDLQHELADIEEKIAYARQFYNSNVLSYNTKTATFPSVIFAGIFGFKPEEFFQAEEEARQDVKVSFSAPTAPTPPPPPAST